VESDEGEYVDSEYVILVMMLSCYDRVRVIQSNSSSPPMWLTSGYVVADSVSASEDRDFEQRTADDLLNAPSAGRRCYYQMQGAADSSQFHAPQVLVAELWAFVKTLG
jgi:hypothetical protein